jgi:iron complex transport system ATP-binding protein
LRHARIVSISGAGRRVRCWLPTVFATEPEVFPLDEPTADLDPAASHAIPRLSRERAGAEALVVPHAVELSAEYAHLIVLVNQGRTVAEALPETAGLFGMLAGSGPRLLPLR